MLTGKRVVVTRSRKQASALSERLRALGAIPIEFPTIAIVPPADDYAALDAELQRLETYDWLVFTSVNAVEHVWQRLGVLGIPAEAVAARHIAAIGPATAAALEARGVPVNVVPEQYVAEALLEAIPNPAGLRFLLPRADIARAALREGLQAAGAEVVEVTAYRTVPATPPPNVLAELKRGVDVITFTSSSTARNFVAALGREDARAIASTALVAAIGPITAQTAREEGLHVDVVAEEHTIEGLVQAILATFTSS